MSEQNTEFKKAFHSRDILFHHRKNEQAIELKLTSLRFSAEEAVYRLLDTVSKIGNEPYISSLYSDLMHSVRSLNKKFHSLEEEDVYNYEKKLSILNKILMSYQNFNIGVAQTMYLYGYVPMIRNSNNEFYKKDHTWH